MTKDYLEPIVQSSKSITEISRKIYGNIFCGNRNTIKKYIRLYNIDVSHFIFSKRIPNVLTKIPTKDILVKNSTYSHNVNLKERLYKEKLKTPICEICGQGEMWNGVQMSLILDHIDGEHSNNTLENLRIVCPNCNATLSTHGGKNSKNRKVSKRTNPNYKLESDKYRSLSMRKSTRPEYDILCQDIIDLGYAGTGRKYDVSDNAIRKWKKYYEKFNNLNA